jgi:hypothetical protein
VIRKLLRRWWVRWLVLPVAALLAAHAGWTLVLKWRFESRLEDLRASGAPGAAVAFLKARVRFADTASAAREISVMLDLASKLERRVLLCVLARWATENTATDSLKVLAGKPGFDARAVPAPLDARFAGTDDPKLLLDAFEGEGVQGVALSRRWIGGESPIRIARRIENPTGDGEEAGEWTAADTLGASWLVRPFAYRDGLRLPDLMDRVLRLVDLPAREALPAAEALRNEYKTGVPNLFSHLFATLPAKAFQQRLRHLAKMRIARVGLALLALRQETGAWPETLDPVVPLVGAEWTIDSYTGERFQYEPGVRLEALVPIADEAFRADDEIVWRFPG